MKRTALGNGRSKSSGSSRKKAVGGEQFAICLRNRGYEASLEIRKLYRVLRDETGDQHALIRVVDESGEDYLYPAKNFLVIDLSASALRAVRLASQPGGAAE